MGDGGFGLKEGGEAGERAYGAAEAVARRSYGKLVAFLATQTRDVAAAEDALADAFAAALVDWPQKGCPSNPEGWLLTVARRRAIDFARRRRTAESLVPELEMMIAAETTDIPDRRLALLFACAHPAIDQGVRAPLMLQVVLGLDANTIASSFLASPAAMAKRLTRAKEKIRHAGIPFRIPDRDELPARVEAVLDAVYAAFTEGWSDAFGTDATRRELNREAIFLARLIVELLPDEPEALGLLALILFAESRRRARRNPAGEYVPFDLQDASLWDLPMMDEAEILLRRASAIGWIGHYQLEAALQSAHVHRHRTGQPNWPAVVRIYNALLELTGSPVVAINRALAIAKLDGAAAGLAALDRLAGDPRLESYQPYWAARAQLLAETGENAEARESYQIAIGLERDPAVRVFLERRQAALRA